MPWAIVGKKCGMTRIFDEAGASVPVTVIEVAPNRVCQIKTPEKEGYSAVQLTRGQKKTSRLRKPEAQHYAGAGVEPGTGLWEVRLDVDEALAYKCGDTLGVNLFQVGQDVDVTANSKGKGFQGGVKRWNFKMQDATHGNSLSHRAPGSIGQCQTPGRVFKGKKMAGHMGDKRTTVQNQKIVRVDAERNLILIKGAVPGAPNGYVIVRPSVKKPLPKREEKA